MISLVPLLSLALTARASPLNSFLLSRQESLNACLDAAELTYVDVNSDDWADAIEPHNLRVPVTPKAVVYATTTEQIQDAVLCGVDSGIKIAAKSGGHSYASMGLGGEDGHLVIQLDRMHHVTLRDDNTAVITAGTRLGVVALELYERGKRAISHGTCPRSVEEPHSTISYSNSVTVLALVDTFLTEGSASAPTPMDWRLTG